MSGIFIIKNSGSHELLGILNHTIFMSLSTPHDREPQESRINFLIITVPCLPVLYTLLVSILNKQGLESAWGLMISVSVVGS